MDNKSDVPDGWEMPDNQAKNVSEALNRKSTTPEDELQAALDDMACDIALIEPNPQDRAGWVTYLLEQLEVEAQRRGKQAEFVKMMKSLLQ